MPNTPINTDHSPLVSISYISENAVLLEWPERICAKQHQHIMYCQQQICSTLSTLIIDCVTSYASLIIYYKFDKIEHDRLNTLLLNIINTAYLAKEILIANTENTTVEIPVYYGDDSAWDMQSVAQQTKLSIKEIIRLHTQRTYRAYALGFTPGFCYLGELPKQLHLPRKSSPRLAVPKGSVAIAEQQTAIYPNTSPGGWHIIGQTPIEMYQVDIESTVTNKVNKQFKSTIRVGQSVKFRSISKTEFLSLGGKLLQEKP